MRVNICILLAAVFLLIPSVTHAKSVKHSYVALTGAGMSHASGKQVFSFVGQALPYGVIWAGTAGSKYTASDLTGPGSENHLTGAEGKLLGLGAIYPNPIGPSTNISYGLEKQAHVSISVYDVSGRLVRTLVDETKSAGVSHSVTWDGTDDRGNALPNGIYFCQFVTKEILQTHKVILLK